MPSERTQRPLGGAPGRDGFRWELVAPSVFLFVLPITHTTPLRIAALVLAAIGAVASARGRVRAVLPDRLVLGTIAAWIVVCLVASLASGEPAYSWGEFRNEVVSPVGAFVVFFFLTSDARALRWWRNALFASIVVFAFYAVANYHLGDGWSRDGFVGDRNASSTYVVLVVPFLLMLVAEAPTWRMRVGVAVVIALALVAAALTQNRNIWFSIMAEGLLFGLLRWWRLPRERRRTAGLRLVGAAAVGAVVVVGTLAYVVREKAQLSNLSVESQMRPDQDPRLEIWAYAGERIAERPWTGYGYGRGILRKDFRARFDNNLLKWHGHNMVVNYLLEAGVVGGLVLVALFAALAWQSFAIYRVRDPSVWPLGAWALTMLVGIALKVMTDDVLIRENSLLFWSVLGMVFGYGLRRRGVRSAGHDGTVRAGPWRDA